jgi:hypothetical protein
MFRELERLIQKRSPDERKKTSAAATIHELAERIHKRSLVILFSDMFDSGSDPEELFRSLQHLRHNKHEVILFHVVDKSKEIEFTFENRPFRFIDLETGNQVRLFPGQVRDRYREIMEHFKEDLKIRCGQYRIDFIETDIHAGFEQVLLPYLVKRSRLF